jgi:hypothetical protein
MIPMGDPIPQRRCWWNPAGKTGVTALAIRRRNPSSPAEYMNDLPGESGRSEFRTARARQCARSLKASESRDRLKPEQCQSGNWILKDDDRGVTNQGELGIPLGLNRVRHYYGVANMESMKQFAWVEMTNVARGS